MISGYKRQPKEFDWCGAKVWLLKLTQADNDAIFGKDPNQGWALDVVMRSLSDKEGTLLLTDREAAEAYFNATVAADDFAALARLVMTHSGYDMGGVEVQKKS
jgi:hypothetical protein